MKKKGLLNRRSFIKTSAIGVAGLSVSSSSALLNGETDQDPAITPRIKKYSVLGRTGFKASDIGLGTSRSFDVPVISALLDAGINYIDTGESYGRGSSEKSIGKAIQGRDRKSLFITTKLHLKEDSPKDEILKRFEKCRARLKTEYIDCLMIHGAPSIAALKNPGFHNAVAALKKEGKLRFTGVSSHGDRSGRGYDAMKEVLMGAVDDGRFDVILVVYNFMKTDPGETIIKAAKKKNIGVTIMKSNPVNRYITALERIDKLKSEGKEPDQRTLNYLDRMKDTAESSKKFMKENGLENFSQLRDTALKFVLQNPGADVLNLAFRSFDDIENMLKLSGTRLAGTESEKLKLYAAGADKLYCRHGCNICEPACPENVQVNTILRYNHYFDAQGNEKYAMEKYAALDSCKPDACSSCPGHCESACPHHLPVKGLLAMAHMNLTLC